MRGPTSLQGAPRWQPGGVCPCPSRMDWWQALSIVVVLGAIVALISLWDAER